MHHPKLRTPSPGDLEGVASPPLQLEDYEPLARARLPGDAWDYVQGGSGSELTLAGNRRALDQIQLRPRHLVDVSERDLSTSVLGEPLSMPVGIAPLAYHCLVHPEGEVASARAAGELGALLVVSIFATRSLEEIAEAASGPLWLQLYWLRRRQALRELVRRAEDAGYRALVLTVDTPWVARRLRDARNAFRLPDHLRAVNVAPSAMRGCHESRPGASAIQRHSKEQFDPSITWSDLGWLREVTRLPLIIKGILTGEDAERAVTCGVDGIIVSNHGGRQLDGAQPSADALPEVVSAVRGSCPVFFDGGVRRGSDVLKALALGADLALVGRPVLWGLACAGADGVASVLRILFEELEEAMVLTGRPRLAEIDRSAVCAPGPRWDPALEGRARANGP